jgi:cyclopropane-fatty-acyl-phospholipid synthase
MASAKEFVTTALRGADVTVGGSRPQDIVVHDDRFYHRILRYGALGLGESYMDGWWDARALDFRTKILGYCMTENTSNLSK